MTQTPLFTQAAAGAAVVSEMLALETALLMLDGFGVLEHAPRLVTAGALVGDPLLCTAMLLTAYLSRSIIRRARCERAAIRRRRLMMDRGHTLAMDATSEHWHWVTLIEVPNFVALTAAPDGRALAVSGNQFKASENPEAA